MKSLRDTLEDYLLKVATRKALWSVAGYVVGAAGDYLAGPHFGQAQTFLLEHGVTVAVKLDPDTMRHGIEGLGIAGFRYAHDFLKLHTGWSWL